jgi:hypothetical protein
LAGKGLIQAYSKVRCDETNEVAESVQSQFPEGSEKDGAGGRELKDMELVVI